MKRRGVAPAFAASLLITAMPTANAGTEVVAIARQAIGKPYAWGAAGPDSFDCSGLVVWVYAQIGMSLPHSSQMLAQGGAPVDMPDVLPGDIITFYPGATHVAIYSGDGNIIQAATYGRPVAEAPLAAGGPLHNIRRYGRTPAMLTGLDYAGGRPSGATIKAAGYSFVCRYLSDGGSSLPGKLLLPAEADDLRANGIDIVSNWETTADRLLDGYDAGAYDAQAGLNQVLACGGRTDRPIYFSADFDATPAQQAFIDAYLSGAATVLGVQNVGIYGGYWPLSRALDNGTATWAWQTEAWSGSNRDPRINLMQRNGYGYAYVGGVQCDVDEAHTVDYGQWSYVPSTGGGPVPTSNPPATPKPNDPATQTSQVWDQLLIRWDMLGSHTVVEALAAIGQKLGINGFTPPEVTNV